MIIHVVQFVSTKLHGVFALTPDGASYRFENEMLNSTTIYKTDTSYVKDKYDGRTAMVGTICRSKTILVRY